MFNWTQPIGKKSITWKPLTIGDEMDIEANFSRPESKHLQKYESLRRRIITFGDAPSCGPGEFRVWDSRDVGMFAEEVERKESMRGAAFDRSPTGDTFERLKRITTDLDDAFGRLKALTSELMYSLPQVESSDLPLSSAAS